MKKLLILLAIMAIVFYTAKAQLAPLPAAVLNYTQVMFEYPRVKGASHYVMQLVQDTAGPLFAKPLLVIKDSTTATRIDGLKFGKKYLWRYAGVIGSKKMGWNGPYGFEIAARAGGDIGMSPVTVLINDSTKNMGGLIAADFQCIINRGGNPVWQMPMVDGQPLTLGTRDIRITKAGTITFLNSASKPIECDLNGNVLWQAPIIKGLTDDTSEFFHHDFQRLPNGNYMVLGDKFVWKTIPGKYKEQILIKPAVMPNGTSLPIAPNPFLKTEEGVLKARFQYGRIIEFNKDGEVVWRWNSESYISDETMFSLITTMPATMGATGMPAALQGMPPGVGVAGNDHDPHLNAFSVDAEGKYIYAGFRQLSRVLKIEKATGRVIHEWGKKEYDGNPGQGDGFFSYQHGAEVTGSGDILVFDNGSLKSEGQPSRIVKFSQGGIGINSELNWVFSCELNGKPVKSHRGGNADELPNSNILVCMGTCAIPGGALPANMQGSLPASGNAFPMSPVSHLFEVTPSKQVVWYSTISQIQRSPYRAHYISSLYPCYFTTEISSDTFTAATTISVNNEGSEIDSYIVSINFIVSGLKQTFNMYDVSAGRARQINLNAALLPPGNDKVLITVQSVNNPNRKNVFNLPFVL